MTILGILQSKIILFVTVKKPLRFATFFQKKTSSFVAKWESMYSPDGNHRFSAQIVPDNA
jgi:hypothetical protein